MARPKNRRVEWKDKVLNRNNGRLLIQIKIDFDNVEIISLSVGNVIIGENKCKIIGFDHTKSLVIYDTLPTVEEQEFTQYPELNAKIHKYEMIRLNDLVDRWMHIF